MSCQCNPKWPILADAQQQKAILPILDALQTSLGEGFQDESPALAGGTAGRAIFMGYLSRLPGKEPVAKLTLDILGQAVDRVGEVYGSSFFGGYSGIAWAVEHLQKQILTPAGIEGEEEDGNLGVDEVLIDMLDVDRWRSDYDLIGGLVGYGVYALERVEKPTARQLLERVLDHLEKLAVRREVGISWHTSPELLTPWQLSAAPEGYYNLGLAHGVPGVLLLLAAMQKAGIQPERSSKLLKEGVAWFFTQFQNPAIGSYLGAWCTAPLEREEEESSSRVAWCYGDLGASLALWQMGQLAGESAWQEKALELARLSAKRSMEDSGVKDVGLCHGSAGNMVIFLRLYQHSGEKLFLDTARMYLDHLIQTRTQDLPHAGYTSYSPSMEKGKENENPHQSHPGLLEGAAGAGLGLLAALGVEPTWDRYMMLTTAVQ